VRFSRSLYYYDDGGGNKNGSLSDSFFLFISSKSAPYLFRLFVSLPLLPETIVVFFPSLASVISKSFFFIDMMHLKSDAA
jgi:hypothetical protein